MTTRTCRLCTAPLETSFADLGMSPLSNSFIRPERASAMEPFYPLHAWVCDECRLVQLEAFETPAAIFSDYIYFSSYSETWLRHAQSYASAMKQRFGLDADSLVIEVASNDGYLLQYFKRDGIAVLGIEPAGNVAAVAIEKGVPSEVAFFGKETARRLKEAGREADLMAANNVLAHVPDLNDFIGGFAILLKPEGVLTIEFPSLEQLIIHSQFDTIYHEHFSYLSLHVVQRAFARHGLRVFDVERLSTHGGSLRVFVCHADSHHQRSAAALDAVLADEAAAGLEGQQVYREFAHKIVDVKVDLLKFLITARADGKKVVAYGAPAKGNTLLNYCGVGPELVTFTADLSPHKQGMLLPGSRIPVCKPEQIFEARPDYVLILPWNLKDEITQQLAGIREWGGQFVVPIPDLHVIP